MTEDIKSLIEKIQQEGIQAAEDKAKEIEAQARRQAEAIIKEAKAKAAKLIEDAQDKISKAENSSLVSLQQAARDLLLTLRKDIEDTLGKIIKLRVQEILAPAELTRIITHLAKGCSVKDKDEIVISLSKEDLAKLEKGFLSELKAEIKKGIILKASEDIHAGFIISYDSGKSHFDFTDKALADYISSLVKPGLAQLLKD